MNQKLTVVTTEPFPVGMAATNRMLSYLLYLKKYCDINVLITKPTEKVGFEKNKQIKGTYKGIKFEYISKRTIWPQKKAKLEKVFILILSYLSLFFVLNKKKTKSILIISNNIFLIYFLFLMSRVYKIKLYQEKSEFPQILNGEKKSKILRYFYISIYKRFNGMIVMTEQLKVYFESIGQKNLFLLPMSVDFSRFKPTKKDSKIELKTIFTYCGGGNYERDGLLFITKSFIDINKKYNNFEFRIIGPLVKDSSYLNQIFDKIIKNNAREYIRFLGEMKSDSIPWLLSQSHALIMAPLEDFKSGGFPTKLGEFLATGKPVICTKVSEIPKYLDETSALTIEPNNEEDLKKAIIKILTNYQSCIKIGMKGREIAFKAFRAENYVSELNKFFGE